MINFNDKIINFIGNSYAALHSQTVGNKKIYNLIGQKIIETDAPNINISNFRNGIYILSINGQKYKIIKK